MGDQSFKINFGSDGTARLREKVNEKLKEIMGDYTDDTLVDYVIVLLRNGRSKDEATRELNVFLGDDSNSFVSWLWDHLSSKLHLYAQLKESNSELGRHNSQQESMPGSIKSDTENEMKEIPKNSSSRRNIEWKGPSVQENRNPFPLRSTVTKILHSEDRNSFRPNIRQSLSPRPHIVKKRSLEDDQPKKRDGNGASRRLLQFAVRDAVKTVQLTNSKPVPALKRLRSVVSTYNEDSLSTEKPQRLRSIALKAAAEAAEDTTKNIYSRSVFDRISSGAEYNKKSEYDANDTGDVTMLDRDNDIIPEDSVSDNDGYNNAGVSASAIINKPKESLTFQYSVAQDANEVARDTRLVDRGLDSSGKEKSSSKIVNISVNVNTWKPPHYEVPRDVSKLENRVVVNNNNNILTAVKTNAQLPKENNAAMAEKVMVQRNVQMELQKTLSSTPGPYATNRPSEDADSRTIFVSNVHFAATKDTLSRHFNKFGEVLKVIILNDAATGLPKGSAYVEFLRKESAESALSLNGTYFMSRSLKVVRKSESTIMTGWPGVARASPFASRISRAAFPRGVIPSVFRGRPIKPGARSLQWKRDGSTAQTTNTVTNVSSPTGRNLTYVRPELKVNPNTGPA